LSDAIADVIVIGSGPAGAQASAKLVDAGLDVVTVDVGERDDDLPNAIPARGFSELRRTDPNQRRYFVGDGFASEAAAGVRVGAQLTPPRQFIVRNSDRFGALRSQTFTPMQSFSIGGLGAGWGSGCQTFTSAECALTGLPYKDLHPFYSEVAADIGICGSLDDDTAENMLATSPIQPPHQLDTNAQHVFDAYLRKRSAFHQAGFRLGRATLAMLSEPLEIDGDRREKNPYHDMDFYSDRSRSVYRPRFTIERLRGRSNYRYLDRLLAWTFEETDDHVALTCNDLRTGTRVTLKARSLMLAAGAINTGRLAARSKAAYGVRLPLISNAYQYIPAINLRMLGRPARDERHSMAQLIGALADGRQQHDQLVLNFFSYRSLLLYKLVKEMPLPPELGLLVARLLMTSLTVIGLHHPDYAASSKWLSLERSSADEDILEAQYVESDSQVALNRTGTAQALRTLTKMGLIPMGVINPGAGSSIHYAGPLSIRPEPGIMQTAPSGALHSYRRVYVGDSAGWNFLPAKGPTLSIMANARRVAAGIAQDLKSRGIR
jgi:choline dehydrogenase-like flavoprotein